jgi:hypothetical protein
MKPRIVAARGQFTAFDRALCALSAEDVDVAMRRLKKAIVERAFGPLLPEPLAEHSVSRLRFGACHPGRAAAGDQRAAEHPGRA